MDRELVSVVLTTFNSDKTISDVLNGIIEQDYPLSKIELIIVDGGSRDNTLKIIESFMRNHGKSFYDVKLIVHDKNYGLSRARNDGIKVSRGDYILILDDDVILGKSTIRELLEFLSTQPPHIGGVMPLHINIPESRLDRFLRKIKENKVSSASAIASCVLLRREMIEKIGLYDETLGLPFTMGEEIEYYARALRHGYRVLVAGHISVIHAIDADLWETIKKRVDVKAGGSRLDPGRRVFPRRAVKVMRSLLRRSYIYAYRRYFSSAPLSIKVKWTMYLLSLLSTISLVILYLLSQLAISMRDLASFMLVAYIPLLLASYTTVLAEYWNTRYFYISMLYSAIAFIWRVIRSIALLIPVNRYTVQIS